MVARDTATVVVDDDVVVAEDGGWEEVESGQ
jgi:hypothetical protein